MRVPLYNDYPLPPQQAAAAAQHPMLAPRPIDSSTAGYQPYPPSQAVPLAGTQTANAPQFYYPAPTVHAVPWSDQPPQQDVKRRTSSATSDTSGLQSPAVASDQSNVQFQSETAKLRGPAETNWANTPINDLPPNFVVPGTDRIREENFRSQVRIGLKLNRICMATVLKKTQGLLPRKCGL